MINDIDYNLVNYWTTNTITKNGDVFDVININYSKNKILLPYYFKKHKCLIFNNSINDYVIFYSHDISFLNNKNILNCLIPYCKNLS